MIQYFVTIWRRLSRLRFRTKVLLLSTVGGVAGFIASICEGWGLRASALFGLIGFLVITGIVVSGRMQESSEAE